MVTSEHEPVYITGQWESDIDTYVKKRSVNVVISTLDSSH